MVLVAIVSSPASAEVTVADGEPAPSFSGPSVALLFTGDMLIHPRVSRKAAEYGRAGEAAYDFRPMFDQVRPLIEAADFAICHQEVQLGVPGRDVSPFPALAAPAEFAGALADAGFDACSTASNHATDHGDEGLRATIAVLDEAGLEHTGTAASERDAGGIIYEVPPLRIGHASYTYSVQMHGPAHEWSVNMIDPEEILADAAALKARGADFVVISLHWGQQYRVAPTDAQRSVAETLTASPDIDLIVGHHAHVLQPIEHINGTPVIFGLGNFLSNQAPSCCGINSGDGAAALVRLRAADGRWMVTAMRYVPTWVHRKGGGYIVWPTVDTTETSAPLDHLAASRARSQGQLTFNGVERSGLSVADGTAWLERDRAVGNVMKAGSRVPSGRYD
jgi:poly-gamma-glutamate synthesis protein (capsule biosynthesis protein)